MKLRVRMNRVGQASRLPNGPLNASGASHLFNRLFQATGDAEFKRAADTWYGHTLAMRNSQPIAGFPRGLPINQTMTWDPGADLLTGAAGVALALHAAISSIEPAWDRLLFADLPVSAGSAVSAVSAPTSAPAPG